MPRDGSGNYTLPAGNPVVTGTTVSSAWANTTMSDVAVQLNNVLTRDGLLGPVGPFKLVDGAVATPGLAFNSEAGLGLYRIGSNTLAVATQNATPLVLSSSDGSISQLRVSPRLPSGTPQGMLTLQNQPYGTANRTEASLVLNQTELFLGTAGVGTGSALPIRLGNSTTVNGNLTSTGPLTVQSGGANVTGGITASGALTTTSGNSNINGTLNVTSSNSNQGFQIVDTGASGPNIRWTHSSGSKFVRVVANNMEWINSAYNAVIMTLSDGGTLTANNVGIYSDATLKENIVPSLGALRRLLKVNAYTYNLIGREDVEHGVIAQELEPIYPNLVYTQENGKLAVKYLGLIPELIQAVRELSLHCGIVPEPLQ